MEYLMLFGYLLGVKILGQIIMLKDGVILNGNEVIRDAAFTHIAHY